MADQRARHCPQCGLDAYPRLAPAVIVLVERDDGRALLARNASFSEPFYSCLAGFVEPGETLEEAVHREVREEVGSRCADLRYFASQPWPFPHSLMIGFTARLASGELRPDGREITEAAWFTASDLPRLPGEISIARALVEDWRGGAFRADRGTDGGDVVVAVPLLSYLEVGVADSRRHLQVHARPFGHGDGECRRPWPRGPSSTNRPPAPRGELRSGSSGPAPPPPRGAPAAGRRPGRPNGRR